MSRPASPGLVSRQSQEPGWPGRLHRVVRRPFCQGGERSLTEFRREGVYLRDESRVQRIEGLGRRKCVTPGYVFLNPCVLEPKRGHDLPD